MFLEDMFETVSRSSDFRLEHTYYLIHKYSKRASEQNFIGGLIELCICSKVHRYP